MQLATVPRPLSPCASSPHAAALRAAPALSGHVCRTVLPPCVWLCSLSALQPCNLSSAPVPPPLLRLAEANLQPISREVAELYGSQGRRLVAEAVAAQILGVRPGAGGDHRRGPCSQAVRRVNWQQRGFAGAGTGAQAFRFERDRLAVPRSFARRLLPAGGRVGAARFGAVRGCCGGLCGCCGGAGGR